MEAQPGRGYRVVPMAGQSGNRHAAQVLRGQPGKAWVEAGARPGNGARDPGRPVGEPTRAARPHKGEARKARDGTVRHRQPVDYHGRHACRARRRGGECAFPRAPVRHQLRGAAPCDHGFVGTNDPYCEHYLRDHDKSCPHGQATMSMGVPAIMIASFGGEA